MATQLHAGQETILLNDKVKKLKIGIITARWNPEITDVLAEGAYQTLKDAGIENILSHHVPGSFELPLGAQYLIEHAGADAVICIGCLIKGETPHFHYISEAVTLTLSQMNIKYLQPVVFGVLTVDTLAQAQDRAGGNLGNKGSEAAQAALAMLMLKEEIKTESSAGRGIGFAK